jgi:hypothetical protein
VFKDSFANNFPDQICTLNGSILEVAVKEERMEKLLSRFIILWQLLTDD